MAMWSKRTLLSHENVYMGAIFTAPLKTFGSLVSQGYTACREIEPRVNHDYNRRKLLSGLYLTHNLA